MLEEKRELIDKIKALDIKNYMALKETKEYRDLQSHFNTYNFGNSILECLIDEIDGLYIEGNAVAITRTYDKAMIKLQINCTESEYDINYMDIKVPYEKIDLIKDLEPETGVRIKIDYDLTFYGSISLKEIEILPEFVFPIHICPMCKNIYRQSNAEQCSVCNSEVLMTVTTREQLKIVFEPEPIISQ